MAHQAWRITLGDSFNETGAHSEQFMLMIVGPTHK